MWPGLLLILLSVSSSRLALPHLIASKSDQGQTWIVDFLSLCSPHIAFQMILQTVCPLYLLVENTFVGRCKVKPMPMTKAQEEQLLATLELLARFNGNVRTGMPDFKTLQSTQKARDDTLSALLNRLCSVEETVADVKNAQAGFLSGLQFDLANICSSNARTSIWVAALEAKIKNRSRGSNPTSSLSVFPYLS